jgi:hypothetical protein
MYAPVNAVTFVSVPGIGLAASALESTRASGGFASCTEASPLGPPPVEPPVPASPPVPVAPDEPPVPVLVEVEPAVPDVVVPVPAVPDPEAPDVLDPADVVDPVALELAMPFGVPVSSSAQPTEMATASANQVNLLMRLGPYHARPPTRGSSKRTARSG